MDNYGTISICVHGRDKYEKSKIAELYPGTSDRVRSLTLDTTRRTVCVCVFVCVRHPIGSNSMAMRCTPVTHPAVPGLRVSVEQIGGRYYLINTLFSVPEGACL